MAFSRPQSRRSPTMSLKRFFALVLGAGLVLSAVTTNAAPTDGFKKGSPELKSAGPLTFGPEGILFIGDPKGATIVAIETSDKTATSAGEINVSDIDSKVAAKLGTDAKQVQIVDLA